MEKPITLSEARLKLKIEYEKIINAVDNNVYLLKCATGLGKSELIKNTKNVAIAFPSHVLKNEHFSDTSLSPLNKLSTPEATGFTKRTQTHFDALYRNGFSEIAYALMHQLADGKPINEDGKADQKDIEVAINYLQALQNVKESGDNITIFTTHHRAVLSSFNQPTLIFDENPLNVLLAQDVVPVTDFTTLLGELFLSVDTDLAEKLRECINSEKNKVLSTPNFQTDERTIYQVVTKLNIKSNLWSFFKSDYYIIINEKVSFCTNNTHRLPIDKKIIIADATAPVELHKKLFGDRLVVIEITNVELRGKIVQFTSYSNSKSGLAKYAEFTKSCLDNWPTITYKDQKSIFENTPEEIHWGNATGTNKLAKKNLNVVGTLHYGLAYYMFLSKFCELQVDDFKMKSGKVIYKNLEFTFSTFKNKQLRDLHLEIIEGNSLQAIHRARPIIYPVTVKLYSNMPVAQAIWIWWKLNKPEK